MWGGAFSRVNYATVIRVRLCDRAIRITRSSCAGVGTTAPVLSFYRTDLKSRDLPPEWAAPSKNRIVSFPAAFVRDPRNRFSFRTRDKTVRHRNTHRRFCSVYTRGRINLTVVRRRFYRRKWPRIQTPRSMSEFSF